MNGNASDWVEPTARINQARLGLRIKGRPSNFGCLARGYMPIDLVRADSDFCSARLMRTIGIQAKAPGRTIDFIHK